MLIDDYAPRYDAIETHAIDVAAPPERVYEALRTTDFTSSPVVKALMFLRTLGCGSLHRATTLETLTASGFGILDEQPNREVLLGLAGQFWRPFGNLRPFSKELLTRTPPPEGLALAYWNFAVSPTQRGTRLTTETRVVCTDAASRRKFRAYWFFVGPFSALIRRVMLRTIASNVRRSRT